MATPRPRQGSGSSRRTTPLANPLPTAGAGSASAGSRSSASPSSQRSGGIRRPARPPTTGRNRTRLSSLAEQAEPPSTGRNRGNNRLIPRTPTLPPRMRESPVRAARDSDRYFIKISTNRLTDTDLNALRIISQKPTLLHLQVWSPLYGPDTPPHQQTWADWLNTWFPEGFDPFASSTPPEAPMWEKRLGWELTDDGTLQDALDSIAGTASCGLEEGKIWHTLMSLLHGVSWLHRARTYNRRNWFLMEGGLEQEFPLHRPVVHGRIDPNHIFYNKTTDPKRPYGDTKLRIPTVVTRLPTLWSNPLRSDLQTPATYYAAPEETWLDQEWLDPRADPVGARSDIWSIGAVCVRMMGGPYYEDQPQAWYKLDPAQLFEILSKRMFEQQGLFKWEREYLPHEYSSELRSAIAQLLVIFPGDRPDIGIAIEYARKMFIKWRLRIRRSRPQAANQDFIYITPALYRNKAPRRRLPPQHIPDPEEEDIEEDLSAFQDYRSPMRRTFAALVREGRISRDDF